LELQNEAKIDAMTDGEVLDFLRASFAQVHEELGTIRLRVTEGVERLGRLERETAGLRIEIAHLHEAFAMLSTRFDRHDQQLERIERRLDLREAH
jgi:hypothetical protein